MRRPIILICLAEAFGIALAYYSDIKTWQLCIPCVAAFLLLKSSKNRWIVLLCSLALIIGLVNVNCRESHAPEISDGVVEHFSGVVTKVEPKEGYVAVTMRCDSSKILVKLKIGDSPEIYELVGRRASCSGKVSSPKGLRNYGGFDYARYLKSKNIYIICEVSKYRFTAGEVARPIINAISSAKGHFLDLSTAFLDDESFSIMAGLLFGEKGYIEEALYSAFQKNGTAHVLAVSGLHVGLLYALITKLLGNRKNIYTTAITLVILFVYIVLADFSVSVLRASVMIALHLLSFHINRRYDLCTAASFSAILFMTINPYQLFDSGFQLSFCAAYAMGVCLPWSKIKILKLADRFKKDWIVKAGDIVMPCIMIQLAMAPLIAFYYQNFSIAGLFINPFIVALAGLLLPAGLAAFVLTILGLRGILLAGAFGPCRLFAKALVLVNELGTALGGGIDVISPNIVCMFLYYGLFFYFFSEIRIILWRRKKSTHAFFISLSIMLISAFLPKSIGMCDYILPWDYGLPAVSFVDVGQGDCIHIHKGSVDILVDGGGNYLNNIAEDTLKPYLLKNGISSIDLAIITHMDGDHSKGIEQLAEIFDIAEIAYPGTYKAGDEISINDISFDVLWPLSQIEAEDSTNDNCLVMLLHVDGADILLMGDLEEDYAIDVEADIIKLAHHGSGGATSDEMLERVGPAFAVISCGKNNIYGHPHSRILERLSSSGIIYGRTDQDGAVLLKEVGGDYLLLENAAGTKHWRIPKKQKNNPLNYSQQCSKTASKTAAIPE